MKTRKLYAAACGSLLLVPFTGIADENDDHHDIDEIVVKSLPLGRTVEALTQSTSVITGDALTRGQDTSIGEVVDGQLGVSATYFGPISSRPVIRGQFGERVLVLSNGLDTLDASALSEDHAVSIDSILAESVEIIRGPATLLYGSNAAGGIVNVVDSRIREEATDPGFSGAVALSMDDATGGENGALKLNYATDRIIAHFDIMQRDTDNVEIPGFAESEILRTLEGELDGEPEGVLENSDSETDSYAFGLTLLGDDGNFLGFSFTDYESNYGIPGGHAHEEEEGGGAEEEEEEIIRIDLEQQRVEVRGQLGLQGWFDAVTLKAAQSDYGHVELEGDEIGTIYDTDASEIRVELLQKASDVLAGTIGLQYKTIELNAIGEEAFVPPSDTTQIGLYAFQEWTVSDRLTLQGSARLEQQDIETPDLEDYSATSVGFSVGSIFALNDDMALSANLGVTERHPTATELFAFGPHLAVQRFERGSVALGLGELDKELSTNLDVTLRGQYDRLSWTVTAFNNEVSDYVVLSPTGEIDDDEGLPVFDFRQTDASLYGLEAELLVDIIANDSQHLHARFFGDFVHAEEDNGGYLPRITPARYGTSLHFMQQGFDASITVTYNDEQTQTAANELPTDSFTIVDAELSYRVSDPGLIIFLQGLNLNDEDARRHTSPLKDLAPLPGRSIRAGLRWDF